MKTIQSIFIAFFLIACNSSEHSEPLTGGPISTIPVGNDGGLTISINVSGLSRSVTVYESISATNFKISSDGTFDIALPENQNIYDLKIINSNDQSCFLNEQFDLSCSDVACTTEFEPVCAKKPFAGVVCVTAPCPTDTYFTYSNRCQAARANAWIAIETECRGLENQIAFHQKPVYVTNIALLDLFYNPFTIVETIIENDTLSIEFEVSGGCGSHEFTFYADETFWESWPVQISYAIGYLPNDSCDGIVRVIEEFDLLPIKEVFRRAYPEATAENSVIIDEIGTYTFTID